MVFLNQLNTLIMKSMSNIFRAIEKAVNMLTYNNDIQVGNYLVEQRGGGV